MKKSLIIATVAVFFVCSVLCAIVSNSNNCNARLFEANVEALANDESGSVPAATITCSSGSMGACLEYYMPNTTVPMYSCRWTGSPNDNCTAVGLFIRDFFYYV